MRKNQSGPALVFLTASNADEANRIAEMLINKNLAACVQVLPEMRSIYSWKGEMQRDREILILAKTLASKFSDLEREVRAMHSYETPEIISIAIDDASEPYLKWLTVCLEGS